MEAEQTKEGVTLLGLPDGDYGIRGFKTMFNRTYLTDAGGVYDKPSSTWKFADGNAALTSWNYIVTRSEEAHAKKLPAFQAKKKKTAVNLDDDNETLSPPPKRQRVRAPKKKMTNEASDDEDTPLANRKTFKKTTAAPSKRNKVTAAAAAAPVTAATTTWDLACDEVADVKELDAALVPSTVKPRFSLTRPTVPVVVVAENDDDDVLRTIDVANMTHLTRAQCDLLYAVGAKCNVTVTYRVAWEPPALNQTSRTSKLETVTVPCVVERYEIINGRLHLSVRPIPERTFIVNLLIPGFCFNIITPNDRFAFMSQPLSSLRDRNMKNCAFDTTFSSLWQSISRDACQTIAYTLKL